MKDYGMAMEFDTMEVWNKLSGGKPLSDYTVDETDTADLGCTNFERLQKAVEIFLQGGTK